MSWRCSVRARGRPDINNFFKMLARVPVLSRTTLASSLQRRSAVHVTAQSAGGGQINHKIKKEEEKVNYWQQYFY